MTREEAINRLEMHAINIVGEVAKGNAEAIKDYEAIDMAIEALEKQIPKKPIAVDWSEEFEGALIEDRCALCSTYLHYIDRYCPNCGQAIDWSEQE